MAFLNRWNDSTGGLLVSAEPRLPTPAFKGIVGEKPHVDVHWTSGEAGRAGHCLATLQELPQPGQGRAGRCVCFAGEVLPFSLQPQAQVSAMLRWGVSLSPRLYQRTKENPAHRGT